MNLEALEGWIHRAVKEEVSIEVAAAELGVNPRRLDLYRGMVRGHVRTALGAVYEILQGVLGEPLFAGLYEDYLSAWRPAHWVLSRAAEGFPEFLAAQVDAGRPGLRPFHVSLAELEWAAWETRVHPARVPASVEAPQLNPTLTVLQTPWPVVPFALAWQRGEGPQEPAAEESVSLLFQKPGGLGVNLYVGSPALLFALKVTHDGLSAEVAAELSGEPVEAVREALSHAARIGLVIDPGSVS